MEKRQPGEKPVFCFAAVSGGGTRASVFTANVLQQMDSISGNKTTSSIFLISGALGGMIGAAWYRELLLRRQHHLITDKELRQHVDDISGDLLNPLFTSFVARDLLAPPQRFTYCGMKYIKDRGYAFEQKLSDNTHGWMNKSIEYYKAVEDSGIVPALFFNATITRDGRKLIIGTRPAGFLMRPGFSNANDVRSDPDALDYDRFFSHQHPGQLSVLSALRMNATFPYILPNVWLPSTPVIDVMDAGFRDNTGIESSLRFVFYFKDWIKENCSKAVMIQVSDKLQGGWDNPYESKNIFDLFTKPALLTQTNLFRFQEYAQLRELEWFHTVFGPAFTRVVFTYKPINRDAAATLSFHLTQLEKSDLKASLKNKENSAAFEQVRQLVNSRQQ